MTNRTKLFFLFLFFVFADQTLKYFSGNSFCNKNLAWNIPLPNGIFCFAWIIVVAALIYIFSKAEKYSRKIFLILIFSGAISNFVDRLRFGCVVDYIDLKFFPVFNLGDVYITLGTIFILFNFSKFFKLSSRT